MEFQETRLSLKVLTSYFLHSVRPSFDHHHHRRHDQVIMKLHSALQVALTRSFGYGGDTILTLRVKNVASLLLLLPLHLLRRFREALNWFSLEWKGDFLFFFFTWTCQSNFLRALVLSFSSSLSGFHPVLKSLHTVAFCIYIPNASFAATTEHASPLNPFYLTRRRRSSKWSRWIGRLVFLPGTCFESC